MRDEVYRRNRMLVRKPKTLYEDQQGLKPKALFIPVSKALDVLHGKSTSFKLHSYAVRNSFISQTLCTSLCPGFDRCTWKH